MAFSLIKLEKMKDLGITADDRIQYIYFKNDGSFCPLNVQLECTKYI